MSETPTARVIESVLEGVYVIEGHDCHNDDMIIEYVAEWIEDEGVFDIYGWCPLRQALIDMLPDHPSTMEEVIDILNSHEPSRKKFGEFVFISNEEE